MKPLGANVRSTPPEAPRGEAEWLPLLAMGPAVWAVHFLLSYVTVAVWCAKFVPSLAASLGTARWLIGAYTVAALAGIAWIGFVGWRRHRMGEGGAPHDEATDLDRHRFIGFATMLLAGLAFVATLYVALTIVLIPACR